MENYFGDILEKAISRRDLFKIGGILGLSELFNVGYSKSIQTSVKNIKTYLLEPFIQIQKMK
jgi:hypothetical protein